MHHLSTLIRAAIFLVAPLLLLPTTPANACSVATNPGHDLDPGEQAVDSSSPEAPTVEFSHISRGTGPDQVGCSGSSTSCDDLGIITVAVISADDDRTPFDQMGLRVELVDGELPEEASLYDHDIRAFDSNIILVWFDGAKDSQESIDFTLEIRSVDLAGNVSEQATEIRIQHGGRNNCSTGQGRVGLHAVLMGLALLTLAVRRRSGCFL